MRIYTKQISLIVWLYPHGEAYTETILQAKQIYGSRNSKIECLIHKDSSMNVLI